MGSDWQGCQFLALIALRRRRRGYGGLFVIPFTLHKHQRHSAFVAHLSPSPARRADGAYIDLKCLHSAYMNSQMKNDLHELTCKSLIIMVGGARFELATNGLKVRCSTG